MIKVHKIKVEIVKVSLGVVIKIYNFEKILKYSHLLFSNLLGYNMAE